MSKLPIKEMANDIRQSEVWDDTDGVLNRTKTAYKLYKLGYRKQREGEWGKVHYSEGCISPYKHTCSCCGKSYWDCWAENRFPFCPNCGAKMKGE